MKHLVAFVISLPPLLPAFVFAQTEHFEVASVKAAAPFGTPGAFHGVAKTGGPGTADPTRVRFQNFSLRALVAQAYNFDYHQVAGPDWTEQLTFDVAATMPKETSKEQFGIMLQNLLSERFHLSVHREMKELPVYTLTVAKNGPKFKKPLPDDPAADDASAARAPGPLEKDKDGYPKLRDHGSSMAIISAGGSPRASLKAHNEPVAWLVKMLTGQLGSPVVDATGLTGKYDFAMSWIPQSPGSGPPDNEDVGPSIFSAAQDQLGLKLVSKKAPVEILVIDRADRAPEEN